MMRFVRVRIANGICGVKNPKSRCGLIAFANFSLSLSEAVKLSLGSFLMSRNLRQIFLK